MSSDSTGSWSDVFDWPFIPVHQVLDKSGNVFVFGGSRSGGQGSLTYLSWDPTLGTGTNSYFEYDNVSGSNVFCAAQVVEPRSGDIFTFGGTPTYTDGSLNTLTTRFDSDNGTLQDIDMPMRSPRWYATATTLPHGDILVQGGIPRCCKGQPPQITPELYSSEGSWRSLLGARSRQAYGRFPDAEEFYNAPATEERWWYPRSYVMPDGNVLGIASSALFTVDPSGDGDQAFFTKYPYESMGATGSGVMYQPGKILQMGGSLHSSNSRGVDGVRMATVVDTTVQPPIVRLTNPMHLGRHWHTATVLADGKVLVTGGSTENNTLSGVTNQAEIWDPATEEWTLLAAGSEPRLYHSTALLLADGSVSVGGGGAPGPVTNKNAEIFNPPYLFSGTSRVAQASWRLVPDRLTYGQNYSLRLSDERLITRITLVKTGAVTHSFNNDQRFIELQFTQTGNRIDITSPSSATLATPGNYLIYAIDSRGHPSIGSIVPLEVTNLARGKSVRQSSTYSASFPASAAIDGNRNGAAGENSMSHTQLEANPFWEIDLGKSHRIDTISLWNRTDCCADRLSNFRVLVSDNPFVSTNLSEAAGAEGVSVYSFGGAAQRNEFFNIAHNGRYVRIQLAESNYLQLAEVEIFGSPVTSYRNLSPTRTLIDSYSRLRINAQGDYMDDQSAFADRNIRPNEQRVVGMASNKNGGYWLLRDDRLSTTSGRNRYSFHSIDANGNYLGQSIKIRSKNLRPGKQVIKGLAFDGSRFWLLRNDLLSYGTDRWSLLAVDLDGRPTGDVIMVNNSNIIPSRQFLYGIAHNANSGNFWLLRDDLESYDRDRWLAQEITPQGNYVGGTSFVMTDRNSTVTKQTYHGFAGEPDGSFSILRDDRNNNL